MHKFFEKNTIFNYVFLRFIYFSTNTFMRMTEISVIAIVCE